jgi:hypothetical protein
VSDYLNTILLPDRAIIGAEEYHRHPAVGSSGLKLVLRSPAHFKEELDRPSPPTPSMRMGSALHTAILEPELFQKNTAVCPKFSGKGSREATATWMKENEGKLILRADEVDVIDGVLLSLEKHRTARELLKDGRAEESFFWQDPATGLVCKARPDYWKDGMLIDVKSTINASPVDFPKQIANLNYHLQAAFYLDGVSAVLGEPFQEFILVAVEKDPPYAVAAYRLDEATLDVGRQLYRKALRTLKRCKASGVYPAYPDRLMTANLPSWAWPAADALTSQAG